MGGGGGGGREIGWGGTNLDLKGLPAGCQKGMPFSNSQEQEEPV